MSTAISRFKEQPLIGADEKRTEAAGNGCIMRLAPVVIASVAAGNNIQTTMRLAAMSGRETHFSTLAEKATALFAGLLYKAVVTDKKDEILNFDENKEAVDTVLLAAIKQAVHGIADQLKPTGFVVDALEVAVWAFMTTDNFKDGALRAVNMGGDVDTIEAVYGQLAGAFYGLSGIPHK